MDRYLMQEQLGDGTFGTVYRAIRREDASEVSFNEKPDFVQLLAVSSSRIWLYQIEVFEELLGTIHDEMHWKIDDASDVFHVGGRFFGGSSGIVPMEAYRWHDLTMCFVNKYCKASPCSIFSFYFHLFCRSPSSVWNDFSQRGTRYQS